MHANRRYLFSIEKREIRAVYTNYHIVRAFAYEKEIPSLYTSSSHFISFGFVRYRHHNVWPVSLKKHKLYSSFAHTHTSIYLYTPATASQQQQQHSTLIDLLYVLRCCSCRVLCRSNKGSNLPNDTCIKREEMYTIMLYQAAAACIV